MSDRAQIQYLNWMRERDSKANQQKGKHRNAYERPTRTTGEQEETLTSKDQDKDSTEWQSSVEQRQVQEPRTVT